MSNLPISSAPQPSGNAVSAAQPDGANGASDQAAAPFAKVLAEKVDKPAASEANAGEEASSDNAVSLDQAAVPVDALNAILSQIPVEMRGVNVTDRMAQLASGDRTAAAIDPAALRRAAVLATAVAAPSADMGATPFEIELSAQSPSAATPTATNAASKPGELFATSEQKLMADVLRQSAANHQELDLSPAQPAFPQISAVSVSQATITAMAGLAGNQPAATAQSISTPLSSPAWGDDFSQKVSWLVTQKDQIAELHLNPPNLGPLDVVLKISDNQATALFASPHAAVRDAVESALPKLRELLADNGIMLSNATVGDQSPRDRGTEEFTGRKGGSSTGSGSVDNAAVTTDSLSTSPARRHNGMVDTFA